MTTESRFWTFYFSFPGCLPEGDGPLPVFPTEEEAREAAADELSAMADGYDEDDETGDRLAALSASVREIDGPDVVDVYGGDSLLRLVVEETEARGTWTATDRDEDEGGPSVLLFYRPASDYDSPAEEAADALQSLAGSGIETDGDAAYCIVPADRLDEAREELRAEGFLLDDSEATPVAA